MKTILCVIPSYSGIPHPKVQHAIDTLKVPEGYRLDVRIIGRMNIVAARNTAVKETIVGNYDYLLFCDDDNAPKPDALKLLLEADKDIISGIIRRRSYPHHLAIFKSTIEPQTGMTEYDTYKNLPKDAKDPFRIANCGTGFVLYKRDLLEKAYDAYDFCPFEMRMMHYLPTVFGIRAEADRAYGNPSLKTNKDGTINMVKRFMSEDMLFHERCTNAGYQIFAHPLVCLEHYDDANVLTCEDIE